MDFVRTPLSILGGGLLLLAGGCARYASYEHYRPTPVEMAQMRASYEELVARREQARERGEQPLPPAPRPDRVKINPYLSYQVTDQDAVAYANNVRGIFTAKFTNARLARYTSATAQVLLAGAAGAAAAFSGGTTLIAGLAFGSAATPQVGEIFNARERAKVYRECSEIIDFALNDYARTSDGRPSPDTLTPAGRTLIGKTFIAIETGEKYLAGSLPALKSASSAAADAAAVNAELDALLEPKPSPSPAASPAGT